MKRLLVVILLAMMSFFLTAISLEKASSEIAYWNKHFPALADSIHFQAQAYYKTKDAFKPQGKNEKNSDYVIRMLNNYPDVKAHEYDPFMPNYQKMFDAYSQEIVLSNARCILEPYDVKSEQYSITVCVGKDTSRVWFPFKLEPEMAEVFGQNWNSYSKTVYGVYGIEDQPIPNRILIQSADKSFVHNVTATFIEYYTNEPRENLIIPIRNYNSYLVEPRYNAESIFNPLNQTFTKTNYHLNCRSVASNLMANRLIGRTSYNARTDEYNISKWVFNPHSHPDSIIHIKDSSVGHGFRRTSGISPDGRIIIHQSGDGICLYDFETGKRLDKVSNELHLKYVDDGISYAFDPYDKQIYITGNDSMYVYDIAKSHLARVKLAADEIRTDNSYQHMYFWKNRGSSIQIMNMKTKDVSYISLPDGGWSVNNVVSSPDDRLLVIQGNNATNIYVYDAASYKLLRTYHLVYDNGNIAYSIAFTKDGQNLICGATQDASIQVLHLGIKPEELK